MNFANVENLNSDNAFLKNILHRSIFLIAGKFAKLVSQVFAIILFSKYLNLNDYGHYQTIWVYINVAAVIGLFGLPSLILSEPANNILNFYKRNRRLLNIGFITVNLLIFLFIPSLRQQDILFKAVIFLLIIFQNLSIITDAVALKFEREKLLAITNIIFSAGFLAAHLLMVNGYLSFMNLFLILAILFLCKFCVLYFAIKVNLIVKTANADVTLKKTGLQWLHLGLNESISILASTLDKWVILFMLTASEFAIYFNGSYEIPVFMILLLSAGNIMVVELSKNYSFKKVKYLYTHSTLVLSAILFPAFFFLFFYHKEFLLLIYGSKYESAIPLFLISIFILPLRSFYSTAVLQVKHRADLIVKGAVLDILLAVMLMFCLYPLMGVSGIALSIVISTYVQQYFYLNRSAALLDEKIKNFMPVRPQFVIILFSLITAAAGSFFMHSVLHKSAVWGGAVIALASTLRILLHLYKNGVKEKDSTI
jgi:O-antigen/teichoic acid export membrane protein